MECTFRRRLYGDNMSNSDKISWTLISREFNKLVPELRFHKNDKHCKERWFNHLNPLLKKYVEPNLLNVTLIFVFFEGKNGL